MKYIQPLIILLAIVTALHVTGCTKDEEHMAIEIAEDTAEMMVDEAAHVPFGTTREIIEEVEKAETAKT